ncbi:N-terminal nucleophile aminohydrolase, partial [Thermothelomyces heterothallicus CBS 203.75]
RVHAAVNGEIYDPDDALRRWLEAEHGYAFRSRADTELVVALYLACGGRAPEFLSRLRGEFALVLYDEREDDRPDGGRGRGRGRGRVLLARDRFGIKPLFWTVR